MRSTYRRLASASLLALIGALLLGRALPGAADPARPSFRVTPAKYEIPTVSLIDQDGKRVPLAEALGGPEPVGLNFFFASCRTICPVMSSAFAGMREKLGKDGRSLRLVSISIDPDQDTPEVLRSYATRYGAGRGWTFLTGTQEQIDAVLRSFLAESGGKFNHQPLFFFRDGAADQWLRVDGLAGAGDLASVARRLHLTLRSPG